MKPRRTNHACTARRVKDDLLTAMQLADPGIGRWLSVADLLLRYPRGDHRFPGHVMVPVPRSLAYGS